MGSTIYVSKPKFKNIRTKSAEIQDLVVAITRSTSSDKIGMLSQDTKAGGASQMYSSTE